MNLSISLQKKYENFELSAVFSTKNNRIGIFGRSGSGKSTLLNLLAGLSLPDQGTIELNGEILFCSKRRVNLSPEKRRIAVVFQHAHLFPHLSVRRNLLYGYRRTPKELRRIDVEAMIEVLDLSELLDRAVNALSGGERQRVALGRAVLSSPRLLLLDEPLSALDEALKYQIIPYLSLLFNKFDIPFLFVSHSIQEMRLMTEEVIILDQGRVLGKKNPDELALERMSWSQSSYNNLLRLGEPTREKDLFVYSFGSGQIVTWFSTKGEGVVELSSNDIMLFKGQLDAISARNRFRCEIISVFDLDNRVGVELSCGGQRLIATVMRQSAQEIGLQVGREVYAAIKASAFKFLC